METIQNSSLRSQLHVRKEKLDKAIRQMPDKSNLVGLLTQVDSALEKLTNGTYGICEVCHDAVEDDRLLIDPLIAVCLGCLTEVQQHELENDLEFAAKIQRKLLPKNNQSLSGWDFGYHYNPAGVVSGDFTDIIPLNDGSVIFVIGDVSGKGISASLMMTHLHALIRSLLSFGLPVNEIIDKTNHLFSENILYSNYATLVIGKAYPDGTIELCVAGHNPPLLIKNSNVRSIGATGVPVGLFGEAEYTVKNLTLGKGDSLLLYTDGLTESSVNDIEYGEERVIDQLIKSNGNSSKSFIDNLVNDHKSYLKNSRPADDVTILLVKRN